MRGACDWIFGINGSTSSFLDDRKKALFMTKSFRIMMSFTHVDDIIGAQCLIYPSNLRPRMIGQLFDVI